MAKLLTLALALFGLQKISSAEIVYLADCMVVYRGAYESWSELDYYANTPASGTKPGSTTGGLNVKPNEYYGDNQVSWEGATTCGKFPDTTFCAYIASDAASQPYQTYVGHASNGYGAKFNCYKGNGRDLYDPKPGTDAMSSSCDSTYYCSN